MRTAIFIDGLTLFYMLDGKRINFVNFKNWLLQNDENTFNAYFNSVKDLATKNKFFSHIEKSGFTLFVDKAVFDDNFNTPQQKNIDMNITIEAMKKIDQYDKIIIVSGKKTLLKLCESLTLQGKKVVIVATPNSMSALYNKYEQINLDEYIEKPEVLIHDEKNI